MIAVAKTCKEVDMLAVKSVLPMIAIIAVSMVIAAFISYSYASKLAASIEEIKESLSRISKGDLSGEVSYKIYTKDEVIERKISVPQNYSLEITQLGNCILNGEKPYVSPEFSVRNSELMDKVFEEIGY